MDLHFNGSGHNLENLKISAIKKVFNFGQEINFEKRINVDKKIIEAEHQGLNARPNQWLPPEAKNDHQVQIPYHQFQRGNTPIDITNLKLCILTFT